MAMINNKGGTGKTTSAVNLPAALAMKGHRALLVDLDSRASAALSLGIERAAFAPSIADAVLDGKPLKSVIRQTACRGGGGRVSTVGRGSHQERTDRMKTKSRLGETDDIAENKSEKLRKIMKADRKKRREYRARGFQVASKPPAAAAPPVGSSIDNKLTVIIPPAQVAFLDRLCLDIRGKTGAKIRRTEIIRALVAGLQRSGLDLTAYGAEAAIQDVIQKRLKG